MKTIFNPKNKSILTYGETLEPAMKITEQEDADQYKEAYVQWTVEKNSPNMTRRDATIVVNSNLAYYAGYYGDETRARVEKLFKCSHPIFGAIAEKGPPTSEEAFKIGLKLGKKLKPK